MTDGFEGIIKLLAGAAHAQRGFKSPYDAGYDAAIKGPNGMNCHYCWFSSRSNLHEWERGRCDGREAKR